MSLAALKLSPRTHRRNRRRVRRVALRRSHQEIVWLNDIPVATIRTNDQGTGTGVFYVHTDHLNAPTKITRPTNNEVVWRWDHDPFGNGTPNEDPDGNGLIVSMNLRFPGQYLDQETGLYYNYFRYYDPQSGRYVQADPIGLAGGQWNTFGYVGNDPINSIDPWGLDRHHIFPQSGWPNYSDAAKDVFDDSILETAGRHRWSKAHMDYNTATKELAKNFCEENGIDPSKMTSQQARSLVDEITQSSDPRIRQFLEREVGPPQPDIEPSTTPPTPPGMSILGRILFTLSLLGHSDEAR